MEAVVDEDRGLEAHDQIEDGQIQHEHIGWCPQRLGCAEDPDDHAITHCRGAEEKYVEDAQHVVHGRGRFQLGQPVLRNVLNLIRRHIPSEEL